MWRLALLIVACPSIAALVLLTPPASHYAVYDWKRADLFDFYRDFYRATQAAGESVVLVVTGIPHFRGLDDGSRAVLGGMGVSDSDMLAFQLDDIWVRDFFPTQINSDVVAEFGYAPAYLDVESVGFIKSATQKFLRFIDLPGWTPIKLTGNLEGSDTSLLVLDGGGIVVESERAWAVVTERILRDNPSLVGRDNFAGLGPSETCCLADPYRILSDDIYGRFTPSEIAVAESRLEKLLAMNKVAIVPEEPEVPRLGHIDGIANWLAPGVLALSNFSDTTVYESYVDKLRNTFGANLTVVPFPYAVSMEIGQDGFESAEGIYVNFLRTKKAIYLPIFDIPEDDTALAMARAFSDRPVFPVNASEIAIMGGSVHCLSQHYWGDNEEALTATVSLQKQREAEFAAQSGCVAACASVLWLILGVVTSGLV